MGRVVAEPTYEIKMRTAVIGGDRAITYGELDRLSENLALNLLALDFKALDRVVVQLPNVVEFVILYLALQKVGCIPIAALPSQRYAEISQFVKLSGASACVIPDDYHGFDYAQMVNRIRAENPALTRPIILGPARPGFASLSELISRPAVTPTSRLREIRIDPDDPAVFQLSGGTSPHRRRVVRFTLSGPGGPFRHSSRIGSPVVTSTLWCRQIVPP